ncbi:MAG TPA: hypothetical protein VIH59_11550 [Candidatus Tectomicrobia bacterium]
MFHLRDDPKPLLLDQDIFHFTDTKREKVTITLEELSDPQNRGERALPNVIDATLPATGRYLLTVAEHPRFKHNPSFRGNYCVTLKSSGTAWDTLEPTAWVEEILD